MKMQKLCPGSEMCQKNMHYMTEPMFSQYATATTVQVLVQVLVDVYD